MRCNACNAIRERIQVWFDTPASPMPAEVRDHVRECATCRAFVKRWNAVEVGLVGMRDQTPEVSPAFANSLNSRLLDPRPRFRLQPTFLALPSAPRVWRFAMVGAALILLIFAIQFASSRSVHIGGSTIASGRQSQNLPAVHPREMTPDVNLATHSP